MTDLSALPAGFVWGAATSAYQIEGGVDEGGRLPSIWDDFCRTPNAIDGGDDGSVACDSYNKWPEDLAVIRQLGLDSYRFSIAWPRVQPLGSGAVNAVGLGYYDRMVDDLLAVGVRPFVTIYHWDLPSALQLEGGWVARDTALRLADFAGIVAERLGDRVSDWVTLNEPLCSAWIGHLEGRMAPGVRDLRSAVHASYHLLLAHGLGMQAIRANAALPAAIGLVTNLSPCEPATDSEEDRLAAIRADGHTNRWWLDPTRGKGFPQDMVDLYAIDLPEQPGDLAAMSAPVEFMGLNYYFRMKISADPSVATLGFRQVEVPGAATTALGWEAHAKGLEDLLVRLHQEYDAPAVYVAESGSAWHDEPDENGYVSDVQRTAYFVDHIQAVADAAAKGVPVKGYWAWSLLDNFEWAYGYWPRFGLAYVDYETLKRTLKLSGETYRDLIAGHRGSASPAALEAAGNA